MNRPMKAALYSALVFPGAGHFLLKKYIYGLILTGAGIVSLYMVVSFPIERAFQILEKIQRGEVQPDIVSIANMVTQPPTVDEAQLMSYGTTLLIIVWIFGIVDSYRQARKQVE